MLTMILPALLCLIWVICIAMLWNEGMWTNCINLINVVFAALLAMNYWEPVADFAESKMPSFTYLLDYLSMWLVFFVSFIVLRAATDGLSRTQVKFKLPIEQAGRIISVIAIGWIMVCFFLATLHTAPLARTAVFGGFQATPMSNSFFGMAPDRMWLGYVQYRSKNALATSPARVFDEQAEYIFKYGQRRERFSHLESMRVKKSPF